MSGSHQPDDAQPFELELNEDGTIWAMVVNDGFVGLTLDSVILALQCSESTEAFEAGGDRIVQLALKKQTALEIGTMLLRAAAKIDEVEKSGAPN